jgi:hypothetical protein
MICVQVRTFHKKNDIFDVARSGDYVTASCKCDIFNTSKNSENLFFEKALYTAEFD